MIKKIDPTKNHPLGGLWVNYVVKKKGKYFKVEKSIWFEDYVSKKACEIAAKAVELQCIESAKAKAETEEGKRKDEIRKVERSIWTLEKVALDRIEKYGNASMHCHFKGVIRLAGQTLPEDFKDSYFNTIKILRETPIAQTGKLRSESTINRYKATFRMIFRHAVMEGVAKPDMVRIIYKLNPEDSRDRVWTPEEKNRIFKVMEDMHSWLYWAVYFASINPIRASDLFGNAKDGNPGLRRENWNPDENWIQFFASKTRRIKNRFTYLKQIDEKLRQYFSSLPQDCDFLFPKVTENGTLSPINQLNQGYRNEWERICEKADIKDFHFHDLKHCAITFLLDNGYTREHLKDCGIQYTDEMIDRYYHFNAGKAPVIPGFENPRKGERLKSSK